MIKKITILTTVFCLIMALTSCGQPTASGGPEIEGEPASDGSPTAFVDDLGREVKLAWPEETQGPERVAALIGSFAQIWTLAGGEVHASADDAWDEFGLEMAEDAVNLGNTKELSLEKLFSAEPDFIIASANTRQNVEWKETLEKTGVPVAYFRVSNFDEYLNMLKICTEITGRPDLYEKNGEAIRGQIEAVLVRAAEWSEADRSGITEGVIDATGPKVLSMRASASFIRAKNSQDNVLGEILKDLGCINIADSDGSLLENLSIEHILEQDPDYIFFVQQGDDEAGTKANIERLMKDNPAWLELTAVKEGRVFFMDKALYGVKPNHRWGEAYEVVEEILADE